MLFLFELCTAGFDRGYVAVRSILGIFEILLGILELGKISTLACVKRHGGLCGRAIPVSSKVYAGCEHSPTGHRVNRGRLVSEAYRRGSHLL